MHPNDPQPGFFWRGVLIHLPLALLAALGIDSLRQDRLRWECTHTNEMLFALFGLLFRIGE